LKDTSVPIGVATTNVSGLFLLRRFLGVAARAAEVLYWRHAKAARASARYLVEATPLKSRELQQDFYQQS